MEAKKHSWHGPKQIGMMIYTAILFLIGTSIIGGNNNTVFPMFSEIRGWDVNVINVVSGLACIAKAIGVLVLARVVKKTGAKNLTTVTLILSALLLIVFGTTKSLPLFLIVILIIGFLGGGYETVIAVILIIVAIITAICVKNNPEEAGEYPDGDPTYAVNGAEIAQMMKEYKSPFTIGKVLKDKNTWFIGLGSALAFLAVMSYIASAIPAMLAIGYAYTQASAIFAVGGIMGIVGSFIFGIIDQKIGTKKAFVAYFVFIIIGFVALLGMPKGLTFCWISGVVIFAAQGALCNLLPSYVASKYGRWDYTAGYQVIGTIFEIGAGIGVMMTGFFAGNIMGMYIFDIVVLVIGLIFMALSSDKFIGKR